MLEGDPALATSRSRSKLVGGMVPLPIPVPAPAWVMSPARLDDLDGREVIVLA